MMTKLLAAAALLLACAAASAADPLIVYKYRSPDGKMRYSDRPIPGAELIEAFEYLPQPPASPQPDTSKADAAGEKRITKHLADLETAWAEVQASGKALEEAEARRAAGAAPQEGEAHMLASPANPAPPSAGGPMALPSASGPLGLRRGGGLSPEYAERQARLEAQVAAARQRNQEAWARYNQLR